MSIKVWTAYRLIHPSDLWDVLHDIRVTGQRNAKIELTKLYQTYLDRTWELPEITEEEWGKLTAYDRLFLTRKFVASQYKEQVTNPFRDLFDFNAWVGVRCFQNVTCLIPRSDSYFKNVFDFMQEDRRLADWHYQDQTDRDVSVSTEEWNKRRKFYEDIEIADRWQDKVILPICDWDHFPEVDPFFDMADKLRKAALAKK